MYDVIVATDERTQEAVRGIIASDGRVSSDPDHLCLLDDFLDAYDVLLAADREAGRQSMEDASPRPGVLTLEGLRSLRPGEPLRGTPQRQPVGPPLEFLPEEWEQTLWPAAGSCNEFSEEPESTKTAAKAQRRAGRMLRSTVGLERCLRASIPQGMRWWNDEE
mmetsp:Transcript_29138/g.39360  ORF Transcript_29138/g.39360 Transcript_29138/m.39360 type:complete len:163 (+) Transcript_29138:1-489(+)